MLSERLKALREQAGLSQNAFARTFGVAQSTVAGNPARGNQISQPSGTWRIFSA